MERAHQAAAAAAGAQCGSRGGGGGGGSLDPTGDFVWPGVHGAFHGGTGGVGAVAARAAGKPPMATAGKFTVRTRPDAAAVHMHAVHCGLHAP